METERGDEEKIPKNGIQHVPKGGGAGRGILQLDFKQILRVICMASVFEFSLALVPLLTFSI
jgi:hypothetical protein